MDHLQVQFIHVNSWTVQVVWQYLHQSEISNLQIAVGTTKDVTYEQVTTPRRGYKEFQNLAEKKYTFYYKYTSNRRRKTGKKQFFTQYSKAELQMLHDKALVYKYQSPDYMNNHMRIITHLYRNKPVKYYQAVQRTNGKVEKAYLKDWNGDISSPINKQLKGLFFNGVVVNGQPQSDSPFGPTRLNVPVEILFNHSSNLYFTDFYCTAEMHYVTLVIAKQQTKKDDFCQRNLLPLNKHKNHWLKVDRGFHKVSLNHCRNLRVEIFYAHDVDTKFGTFDYNISTRGVGRSSQNGKRKNHSCSICNLATSKINLFADQVGTQQIEISHGSVQESTHQRGTFHESAPQRTLAKVVHGLVQENTHEGATYHESVTPVTKTKIVYDLVGKRKHDIGTQTDSPRIKKLHLENTYPAEIVHDSDHEGSSGLLSTILIGGVVLLILITVMKI